MTSVLSHRLLSNGNRILIFSFLIIFSVSSCKNIRKTEKYQETEPAVVVGPKTDPTIVDTVKWDTKPSDYPPITDKPVVKPPKPRPPVTPPKPNEPDKPDEPTEILQNSYNVAIMAPFYTNKETYGQIKSKTAIKSLEFYAGAKIALDVLSKEGVNLNIHTYDTQGSTSITTSIMNRPDFFGMNLAIGPMKTETLKTAAALVKGRKTLLVSPWNPKTSITSSNPNYIQVNPSLESHCQALMRHARKNFSSHKIVLACRKDTKENNNFKYFQDENKVISRSTAAPKIPELIAEYGDDIPIQEFLQPDTTVFIIASWDEKFVSNLLRKIYSEKGHRHVVVYGMPQWIDFERIGYEYYERLNVHISNSNFMDLDDVDVQNFRRDYFNNVGAVPTKDAILGYDIMLYFGRLLKERGTNLNKFLDRENEKGLHTDFNFRGVFKAGTEDFSKAEWFENDYLNILEYKDFKFQRAD